jgi:uncharacterized protein (TIGR03083 family)
MTLTPARLTPSRAHDIAVGELDAFLGLLRGLGPEDWHRPTDCTGWTVRDVVAHVTGAMEEGAHLRVLLRHVLFAPRRYPTLSPLDAVNQVQLDDRSGAGPSDLLAELERHGPRAARARRRMPAPLRTRSVPGKDNGLPPGSTFAYLVDVIYPRDVWMHRVDVERATGRPHARTATEHDVVAQVVHDLGRTWNGPAAELTTTGDVPGEWRLGHGAAVSRLEVDAVELCRLLSGRAASPTVTSTGEPGAEDRLRTARVTF